MKRQTGFTLIELVVVIVILGILGAIAIPRFIGVQREARIAVLEATQNSLRSGANMVFAIQASAGNFGTSDGADLNNDGADDLQTRFGYPRGRDQDILPLFEGGLSSRFVSSDSAGVATLQLDDIPNCRVTYSQAVAQGDAPVYAVVTTDC